MHNTKINIVEYAQNTSRNLVLFDKTLILSDHLLYADKVHTCTLESLMKTLISDPEERTVRQSSFALAI